ncbi:MAG TPA: endolytic transglycosylase MltG [Pseudonocardia sp.]|jgi:UPF0755 protein|uniref:endolytic transglycosylase MltG n=1 Tax=Pseudonocardia sp. TaxID=60912 RepID=UPI002F3F9A19
MTGADRRRGERGGGEGPLAAESERDRSAPNMDHDTEPLDQVLVRREVERSRQARASHASARGAASQSESYQSDSGQRPGAHQPADRRSGAQKPDGGRQAGGRAPSSARQTPRREPRGRGPLLVLAVLAATAMVGAAVVYRMVFLAPDYEGAGSGDVIIQVRDGDPTIAIGAELTREDVVRSAKAFKNAAADDPRVRAVQPGYYQMRLRMSGSDAVALLVDPSSRVGQLDIRGGMQLDDTRGPDGKVSPGVLSLIIKASCARLNGASTCLSLSQLRNAMETTPPAQLGVPSWALSEVGKADPNRRLEGLIAPGRYDVRPGASADEVLRTLVTSSATQYEATGLTGAAQGSYTPYQLLVIASLVEKEGITPDFGRISGVIHNRLADRVRLELDSTVNYPLDLQSVRTSGTDRNRTGAYNSYVNYGLPPTPIGAPGQQAIVAALQPASGPWMFFVRCEKDGASCFSTTLSEHQQNVRTAMAEGVF